MLREGARQPELLCGAGRAVAAARIAALRQHARVHTPWGLHKVDARRPTGLLSRSVLRSKLKEQQQHPHSETGPGVQLVVPCRHWPETVCKFAAGAGGMQMASAPSPPPPPPRRNPRPPPAQRSVAWEDHAPAARADGDQGGARVWELLQVLRPDLYPSVTAAKKAVRRREILVDGAPATPYRWGSRALPASCQGAHPLTHSRAL